MFSTEIQYQFRKFYRITKTILEGAGRVVLFMASFVAIFLVVYKFGFKGASAYQEEIYSMYKGITNLFFIFLTIRFLLNFKLLREEKGFWLEVFFLIVLLGLIIAEYRFSIPEVITRNPVLYRLNRIVTYTVVLILSTIYLSKEFFVVLKSNVRPEMMFVISFLMLILIGTFLLKLPTATYEKISFIDALFTATSAVCVTGLTVLDTAKVFTPTGDVILLLLIQLGGIGVMTFTSFFAMSFLGKTTFRDQLALKNLLNESSLNNIFRTLFYTVTTTLLIEAVGVYIVYLQIQDVEGIQDKFFFSLFHAVSAFCNAGFSTLPGNLYDPLVRNVYGLQVWLGLLIVFGGLGFPILFNYGSYFKYKIRCFLVYLFHGKRKVEYRAHIVSTTTRIVLPTTLVLLVLGMVFFLFFEDGNTLEGLSWQGKLATSFMASVTTRTAGFNNVDMAALHQATIFLFILLMWIGASPMSTGGGIKTTTFVIALKNVIAILRGEDRVEIGKRQLTRLNVNRAQAIIFLSLAWTALAVMLLSILEPQGRFVQIVFEVFSALGTVGLSLNFTPAMSDAGKIIISLTMFVGRVGLITLLSGVVKQRQEKLYRYADDTVIL
ncbi:MULTISPECIES: TrkH family potassium uptake protein [Sanguibacteroides]|uniref:Uncharacterized protein n=1 Tax=Sanguibacteroides justesenii TaxID=1547597 RepID=A0A0C3NE01_9PORP|nr:MULTISPECIES: potassium transporter TrkG [Sanguibacteroides]KIO44327.1 hypothetical protein BA92_08970 [Sanguibacteroides justesenii]PXZ44699.1 ATPase [Sanguibacteroides justesenii]